MATTKEEYKIFLEGMYRDSGILYNNSSYHNSIYLGGYVLEAFLHILCLDIGIPEESLKHHNLYDFKNALCSGLFAMANPKHTSSVGTLFCSSAGKIMNLLGNGGFPRWHPVNRYDVDLWNDPAFAKEVKDEVCGIIKEINRMKLNGEITF